MSNRGGDREAPVTACRLKGWGLRWCVVKYNQVYLLTVKVAAANFSVCEYYGLECEAGCRSGVCYLTFDAAFQV